ENDVLRPPQSRVSDRAYHMSGGTPEHGPSLDVGQDLRVGTTLWEPWRIDPRNAQNRHLARSGVPTPGRLCHGPQLLMITQAGGSTTRLSPWAWEARIAG